MISSSSNAQIKNLVQLQSKAKNRNKEQVYIIEGIKMFEEVARDRCNEIVKAYVSENCYQSCMESKSEVISYLNQIEYEVVTDKVFKEISETITPQGIMAIVKQPQYHLEDLLLGDEINLVLLEDLRDPGNLGTIIRTAEGAGMTGVIMSKNSVDIFNPKVIRSTMGAIYRVPFVYVEDMASTIGLLQEKQIKVYATHLNTDSYYDDISYGDRTAIVIGNEANGISEAVAMAADHKIKIPMEGKVESLNAGVATSIMMYEILRQRRAKNRR